MNSIYGFVYCMKRSMLVLDAVFRLSQTYYTGLPYYTLSGPVSSAHVRARECIDFLSKTFPNLEKLLVFVVKGEGNYWQLTQYMHPQRNAKWLKMTRSNARVVTNY